MKPLLLLLLLIPFISQAQDLKTALGYLVHNLHTVKIDETDPKTSYDIRLDEKDNCTCTIVDYSYMRERIYQIHEYTFKLSDIVQQKERVTHSWAGMYDMTLSITDNQKILKKSTLYGSSSEGKWFDTPRIETDTRQQVSLAGTDKLLLKEVSENFNLAAKACNKK